ncbi:MAG TPA: UDP-N-acetylglucosamine 1-carboxyvinyltransferase [bacterium]|nr:UDP-N-acetylglucosamine 1-carboxyvinyltransferase [bacterium]HQH80252.1 UDP-N-acetylglucosamine 1-carboxyvinyltransferase [bacterium]
MQKLIIEGNGPLRGKISVSGSKNAALPIMASSLLADGEHTISGVPQLRDITTMSRLLEHIGSKVKGSGEISISTGNINLGDAPYDLVKTMRASVLVMGPLVGRMRYAKVSLPGGCAIGARPIDQHLKALEAMGARIKLSEGYVEISAKNLHGTDFSFDLVTVTGTENVMMAAVLAKGCTVLRNAAREPEIVDLAAHLSSMGAEISGAGTDCITIHGVSELRPHPHKIIPDRIEAGTLLMAAGITAGDLEIQNFPSSMLGTVVTKLRSAGMDIEIHNDTARARSAAPIKSVDLTTSPYPGFPTDLQAQFMAMMCLGDNVSIISETIFENRFMHVPELSRMGADITVDGGKAIVRGVSRLKGAPVMATDLRASASLVLAALASDGTTEIDRIYHLDRGYEHIEKKLRAVGAKISRTEE